MIVKQTNSRDKDIFHKDIHYFTRPRIHKLLEEAISYPLVVVQAGVGYGKTYAVHSFLQECTDVHTTWVKVGDWANDALRFWNTYTELVFKAWPEGGALMKKMGFPDTEEAFARHSAIVRKASKLPGKHVMVYDDFHLLQNPDVLRFIERTMQILPQNIVVILIARTTPEFNLIRMMMNENIFTINEDTLCFTETEIVEYFSRLNLHVDRQHVRVIWEETHGWAFAVNLIGRALEKEPHYDSYVLETTKINIIRFIESELESVLTEPLLHFLLRISLIDHFAANLVKALTPDDTLIDEMRKINAYIRYDFHLDAYIIHHLFLEYLRLNQDKLAKEEKRETYQTAAVWCETHNYEADALSYYEKSEDYAAIMRMMYETRLQMPRDIAECALAILDRMPIHKRAEHPAFPAIHLKVNMCHGFFDTASHLAEQYAEEYEALPESPEKFRALTELYGVWAILRVILSPYADTYDFDKYFKKQCENYDKAPYAPVWLIINQSIGAYSMLVGTNRAGAPEEYIQAIERSLPHISHVLKKNLDGLDDLARGELFFMRRNLDDSEKSLKQALDKARMYKHYDIQHRTLFYLMYIAFFRGDFKAARDSLQAAETLLYEKEYLPRYRIHDIASGFYHLMLGQTEQVPDWLKGDFSPYAHPAFLDNTENLVKAQYHYKTGQYNTLLAFIDNEAERQSILFGKIVLKILQALSLYQLKRRQGAIDALTEAYHLAAPNGIVSLFIQFAKDMRTLTAAALRDGGCEIPKEWLEDINRKSSAFSKKQSRMISDYKTANNLEEVMSLTKRETEILKDLTQGLSRSEIAANQNISINTVKMTVNIIYEKLHASNLAEAIRIASERKII